jgi:tetratricopeptide (TPR) repeat protein
MLSINTIRLCAMGLAASLVSLSVCGQDAPSARATFDQALAERQAATEAAAQGNQEEAVRHASRSRELLDEARRAFDALYRTSALSAQAALDYAQVLGEMGDHDLAAKALAETVVREPDRQELWLRLGEAHAELGRPGEAEAVKALRQAMALNTNPALTADAHAVLGGVFAKMGLYDFAREELDKALELKPDHIAARIVRAGLDIRSGQLPSAADSLDAAEPLPLEFHALLRETLEASLADFEGSGRWISDTAENHLAYGKLLVRVERYNDAYWPLQRATKLDAENYVLWNLMGSVLRAMQRYRGAAQAFTRSLEINADQPRTRDALAELEALVQQQSGQRGDASSPSDQPPAAVPASP